MSFKTLAKNIFTILLNIGALVALILFLRWGGGKGFVGLMVGVAVTAYIYESLRGKTMVELMENMIFKKT